MSKPIFDFKGYSIKNLEYKKEEPDIKDEDEDEDEEVESDDDVHFDTTISFSDDYTLAKMLISVKLNAIDKSAHLILDLEGFFEINDSLLLNDESGNERDFAEVQNIFLVNATAILYPYLRSIVSMVTSLDSESNIVLPIIDMRRFSPQKID